MLDIIDELKNERNSIVHGIWGEIIPDHIPVATSLRLETNPFHVVSVGFPHPRLEKIISTIGDIATHLDELPKILSASQKKYEEQLAELRRNRTQAQSDQDDEKPELPLPSSQG